MSFFSIKPCLKLMHGPISRYLIPAIQVAGFIPNSVKCFCVVEARKWAELAFIWHLSEYSAYKVACLALLSA